MLLNNTLHNSRNCINDILLHILREWPSSGTDLWIKVYLESLGLHAYSWLKTAEHMCSESSPLTSWRDNRKSGSPAHSQNSKPLSSHAAPQRYQAVLDQTGYWVSWQPREPCGSAGWSRHLFLHRCLDGGVAQVTDDRGEAGTCDCRFQCGRQRCHPIGPLLFLFSDFVRVRHRWSEGDGDETRTRQRQIAVLN